MDPVYKIINENLLSLRKLKKKKSNSQTSGNGTHSLLSSFMDEVISGKETDSLELVISYFNFKDEYYETELKNEALVEMVF